MCPTSVRLVLVLSTLLSRTGSLTARRQPSPRTRGSLHPIPRCMQAGRVYVCITSKGYPSRYIYGTPDGSTRGVLGGAWGRPTAETGRLRADERDRGLAFGRSFELPPRSIAMLFFGHVLHHACTHINPASFPLPLAALPSSCRAEEAVPGAVWGHVTHVRPQRAAEQGGQHHRSAGQRVSGVLLGMQTQAMTICQPPHSLTADLAPPPSEPHLSTLASRLI